MRTTSVSRWRHVTVTVWTPRFLTDWASCRRSEPGAKLRDSAQATSLGDKSEALSWHLMPDWPMTLRGETPVWVTYSPVTHLPTDGWVTVMLVHMKQRQLCLQRAVQTHAMLISSPIRWDESDRFSVMIGWKLKKKLSDPKHKWLLDSHVKIILVYKFIVTIEQHSILFQASLLLLLLLLVKKNIFIFFFNLIPQNHHEADSL